MGSVIAIAKGISDAIKTVKILDYWFRQIVIQWMDGQNQETNQNIVDAAALGARAVTQEDRFKVSEAWQKALSRPRITQ